MKLINIKVNGSDYDFICESKDTRTGFKHVITLNIDYCYETTATVYYYNRTWERYGYQTACIQAIGNMIERLIEREKTTFKTLHGYKLLTAARRATFYNTLSKNRQYKELNKVKVQLEHNIY